MRFSLFFLLLIFNFGAKAQPYLDVSEIPNPKTNGNGYVSNPDGIISEREELTLNKKIAEIENSETAQITVVLINSINSQDPKTFANELAEFWGVGKKGADNGLLILLVKDQRRIEFEVGYGMEGSLPDILCVKIQERYMLPSFRQSDYFSGILAGLNEIQQVISGDGEKWNNEIIEGPSTPSLFWLYLTAWNCIGILIYLIAFILIYYRGDPYKKYRVIRLFSNWVFACLFPPISFFLFWLATRFKSRYRNTVRFSGKTGRIMHKLKEQEEDEFLNLGQQAEEIVKSVDYDVWVTDNQDDFTVLSYPPFLSSYSKCPSCRFKTYSKEFDRIVIPPTTLSAGKGELKHTCTHCKFVKQGTYFIPRLQKRSRTSSGWSGGGSRFSGGSSWGGGSFGGGGGGSSW